MRGECLSGCPGTRCPVSLDPFMKRSQTWFFFGKIARNPVIFRESGVRVALATFLPASNKRRPERTPGSPDATDRIYDLPPRPFRNSCGRCLDNIPTASPSTTCLAGRRVERLGLRWRLGHGIERADMGRYSGALIPGYLMEQHLQR